MLLVQICIVLFGFVIWIKYIVGSNHSFSSLFSLRPFHYDSMQHVIQASALAIFSFLGFDAVTTLAEESVNPKKDVSKAMLFCTCIGFTIMFLTGYLGVLAMPNWGEYSSDPAWVNTALFELAKATGGHSFALIYTVGFILAMVICNMVGTTAVTRLLYGMGRDKVLPERLFGAINKRWKTPHGNILFVVILELILGSYVSVDQLAELINFGAISGFIILNFCVVWLGYKLNSKTIMLESFILNKNKKLNFLIKFFFSPLIALIIMCSIFLNMKFITIIFGTIWGSIGTVYYLLNNKKLINCNMLC